MSWISAESLEEQTIRAESGSTSADTSSWSNTDLYSKGDCDWGAGYDRHRHNKYATISSSSSFHLPFQQKFNHQRSKSPQLLNTQNHMQEFDAHEAPSEQRRDCNGRRKSSTAFEQIFSYFKSLEEDPPLFGDLQGHQRKIDNVTSDTHYSAMHNSWTSTSGFESQASSITPGYQSLEGSDATVGSTRSHRSSSIGHSLTSSQQSSSYHHATSDPRQRSGNSDRNSYPGNTSKPIPPAKPNLQKPIPPIKPPRKITGHANIELFGNSGTNSGGRSRSFHPSHQHPLKNVNPNMSKSQHQLNTWYSRTIDWVEGINDTAFDGIEDGPYSLPAPPEGYGNLSGPTIKRSASNDGLEEGREQNYRSYDQWNNGRARNQVEGESFDSQPDTSALYAEVMKPNRIRGQNRSQIVDPSIPSSTSAFTTFRASNNSLSGNNTTQASEVYPKISRNVQNISNQKRIGDNSTLTSEPVYTQISKENPYESINVRPVSRNRSSEIYEEVGALHQHQSPSIPLHQSQLRGTYVGFNKPLVSSYTSNNVQKSSSSSNIPNVPNNRNNYFNSSQQKLTQLQPSQVLEQLQQLEASHNRRRAPAKSGESAHIRSKSEHHTRCPNYAHTHNAITGSVVTSPIMSSTNVGQSITSNFPIQMNVPYSSVAPGEQQQGTANDTFNNSPHSNESTTPATSNRGKSNELIKRRMSLTEIPLPRNNTTTQFDKQLEAGTQPRKPFNKSNTEQCHDHGDDENQNDNFLKDLYARIPPPPPPDVALKRIRSVIKPLFQDYMNEKKMRPKNVETWIEDDYFSCMEAKSGKKVLISNRRIGRQSKQLYPDKSILTDPVPDEFWADKENSVSTGQRQQKQLLEDNKKSLRRNCNSFGTAERKKKHKLSTLPRSHKTRDSHRKPLGGEDDVRTVMVGSIDISDDPKPKQNLAIEKSPVNSGRPPSRSPIERSLSCELRPPNISPFDVEKEWAVIESIVASFATQTSTASSDQISSDQGCSNEAK